jgi:hypothetical protein
LESKSFRSKIFFPERHLEMSLKGFRGRDYMPRQQLADLSAIRQSRVRDFESGARSIGKTMAQRLAKVSRVSSKVFL